LGIKPSNLPEREAFYSYNQVIEVVIIYNKDEESIKLDFLFLNEKELRGVTQ
jgi:hypothetical protein